MGLAFDDWQTTVDTSAYTGIRLGYKGIGAGHRVNVKLGYRNVENSVEIGVLQTSANWQVVEFPIPSTMTQLISVSFIAIGTEVGEGVLWIDGIELTGGP